MKPKLIAGPADIRTFLSVILICLGLMLPAVLYAWYQDYRMAQQSNTWPSTQRNITVAKVFKLSEKQCRGSNFNVDVQYSYFVAGKSYRASRLGFGPGGCYTEISAKNLVEAHPIGPTPVWYNQVQPEISTLKPGALTDSFWANVYKIGAISFGPLLLAACLLLWMRLEVKRQRPY